MKSSSFTLARPCGASQSERRGPLGPRKYLQAPVAEIARNAGKSSIVFYIDSILLRVR